VFTLRFDMRAPSWGAPPVALYGAAPEMCAWAEDHGGVAAVFCEHHGSEDGYLPSPFLLASAVAARTRRMALSLILILPFYEPVRLAEDMAVLDIISAGRASYILALGYRPEEFEHFGVALGDRGRLADEKLALLRRLLSGEAVIQDGRRIMVTPRPHTAGGPGLTWGGGSVAAARRALAYMDLQPGRPVRDIAIDTVFIGSCTNSRISDLRAAAEVARGRKVAASVRAWVVPGSENVKRQAEAEGLDRVFRDAGFDWREPGCSMCLAMNPDKLSPGERCASTSNRNFEGRQGKGGRTHLVSPAVAAATAIAGHFATPADLEH